MQKIAAYLLERHENLETPSARRAETERLLSILREWLITKGTDSPHAANGLFVSKTANSIGSFAWTTALDEERSWTHLRLEEPASNHQRFVTQVSVTNTGSTVAVYVTLSAGSTNSVVAPVILEALCPHFVRTMLQLEGSWFHGNYKIGNGTPSAVTGFESGEGLAADITSPVRTIPILIISELEGQPVFPKLAHEAARDLAALARVFVVDDQASWGLTNSLGKTWSCYNGAIRIYWPNFTGTDNVSHHPLWTPSRLLSNDPQLDASLRFRSFMRRTIASVSAFSVLAPPEIALIRAAASRQQLADLQAKAQSAEDFRELAEAFAQDNEKLKLDLAQLQEELVQTQLKYAQALKEAQAPAQADSFPPTPDEQDKTPPKRGDVRFYKKTYSKDAYDVLVKVADCGHTNWQGASKADKAKKGIMKLEGRNDWKNVSHCGTCTGGGMWKVKW